MTANDIIRQLQSIICQLNTGDIPLRKMKSLDVNLNFELCQNSDGEYYIETFYKLDYKSE